MLDIPPDTFAAAYNAVANSTLWFVHHMLYELPRPAVLRTPVRGRVGAVPELQPGLRDGPGPGRGRPPRVGRRGSRGGAGLPPQRWSRGCWPTSGRTSGSRTSRTRRGRRRTTTACCRTRSPARCWTGSSAPTTPGSCASAGPTRSRTAARRSWAPRWTAARQQISYRGHVTGIGVHALGVDAAELTGRAAQPDVAQRLADLTELAGGRKLIVRIDRTELSKNIVRGLAAYRELLVSRPEWRGPGDAPGLRLPVPDRPGRVPRVHRGGAAAWPRRSRRSSPPPDWTPLVVRVDDDYARSLAAYRVADVLLVNPIQGRDEPGGQGGPDRVRPRLRAGPVPRGRRGGRAGSGGAAGQPVRHLRHGRGPARGAVHGRRGASPPLRPSWPGRPARCRPPAGSPTS